MGQYRNFKVEISKTKTAENQKMAPSGRQALFLENTWQKTMEWPRLGKKSGKAVLMPELNQFYSNSSLDFSACLIIYFITNTDTSRW
jgi:hypothetical protein